MPSGPNSGSPNSASGRAVGRWRVPHDDWTLGANHVSRAPESGWPIPLLLISGLATGPPAGVGDGFESFQGIARTSVLARGVLSVRTPRFLDISRHFTVHLFRPWMPNSRRCQYILSELGPFSAA